MPFKSQGSSMLVIQPCYDGRLLPITHQVAADGLSLLSIKHPHRECTLIQDPGSKRPTPSCTQGIKPRNSFWNLHKPELRRIRGLDCTTTDNVIQLFQTHNSESSRAKSYKKMVLSKLGSILNKKSNPAAPPQILVQNVTWPINCCVLSSICHETEIISSEILKNEEIEKTIGRQDFEGSNSKIVDDEEGKDTVFITLPPSSINTSDDLIIGSELLNPSNGDSSTNTTPAHFNTKNPLGSLGYDGSHAGLSSSILLESKQSQHQISIPSNVEFYNGNTTEENCVLVIGKDNSLTTNEKQHNKNKTDVGNVNCQESGTTQVPHPSAIGLSSIAVQSIFTDIFQEIEDIKDVINSYMSSFYVQEEEYNNFPKLHTPTQEVASHFFEQIHGPLKDKSCNPKNMHSTFCHGFEENEQKDYILEMCHKKKSDITVPTTDVKVGEGTNTLQENLNKNEGENEMSSSYCFWEDNDLGYELKNDQPVENMEKNSSNAMVTLDFIENMWEEFTNQVETHAVFLELVNKNEMKKNEHERNFPSYGHWANTYDPNIFHEAENIIHTLDSLLMNGCFPTDEGNNATYFPCTIVELVNEAEFPPGLEEQNENVNKYHNRDENVSEIQEYQTYPHEIETDSTNSNCKRNFSTVFNDPSANEMINRKKNHKIKLSADFSTDEIKYENEEQVKEYIPQNKSTSWSILESSNGIGCSTNEFDKDNAESRSMFEKIQEKNSLGNSNSAFLFSSPTVRDGNVSEKDEYQTDPHENETDSTNSDCRRILNSIFNGLSANEMISRKKNHEIKLEPVFYQEKVEIDSDYSRLPEYEKIQLDPINYEGRVDFSTLQSNSQSADYRTDEIKYENEEQVKEYIPQNNSTSWSILESSNGTGSSTNEFDKDNAESRSMFEKIQEKNSPGNSNSAFLFSSPTVQLNLTNPLINTNKK